MTILDYIILFLAFAISTIVIEKDYLPLWVKNISTLKAAFIGSIIILLSVVIGVTLDIVLIPIVFTVFIGSILSKNVRERSHTMKEKL